jgi:hypothetical protein
MSSDRKIRMRAACQERREAVLPFGDVVRVIRRSAAAGRRCAGIVSFSAGYQRSRSRNHVCAGRVVEIPFFITAYHEFYVERDELPQRFGGGGRPPYF